MKFIALVVIAFVAIVECKAKAQSLNPANRINTLPAGTVADIKIEIGKLIGPLKQLETVLEGAGSGLEPIRNNATKLIGVVEAVVDSIPSSSLPAKDVQNIVNDLESKVKGLLAQVDSNWDLLPSDKVKIATTGAKVNISGTLKSLTGAVRYLVLALG